jgi:acetyltransferase-like isoleucine patch superfamily enzyme
MSGNQEYAMIADAEVAESATVYDQVNLYGCEVGENTKIDAFVYVEEDVTIGDDCTLRPFVFVPTGVTIGDGVFVGPGVTFTNDRYPSVSGDWELEETVVEEGAGIGAGATILPGVSIGADALVGAGSVVTEDVAPGTTVAGNPAQVIDTHDRH